MIEQKVQGIANISTLGGAAIAHIEADTKLAIETA